MINITGKLDKLLEYAHRHDEHLEDLNGTIAKHDTQFKDVYKKTDANTNSVKMAQGGIIVIGLMVSVFTLITLLKGIIW